MDCKCDLRTKLVGDGCQYCNPELAAQIAVDSARYEQAPCLDCGGFGEVTGEYPGVACQVCNGTGLLTANP